MSARREARGEIWQRLGAPAEQVGSVNDPRAREEDGHLWNEKWIYLDAATGRPARVVLWHRYDLVGVFDLRADGSLGADALAADA